MNNVIIIGAGISGLELGTNLIRNNYDNFLILEKNDSIYKQNSWKTLGSLVDSFYHSNCVANNVKDLHMRTFDLETKKIITDYLVSSDNFKGVNERAVILDSKKVYNNYDKILSDKIILNSEIINIEKNMNDNFVITSSNGESYISKLLVDASGVANVTDKLFNKTWFKQSAYFTCYGKRFNDCSIAKNTPSFFDFESPELFGTWCYPVNSNTIELGVSRYSKTMEIETNKEELEFLLSEYSKLHPFDDYLKGSTPGEVISGSIPLLPRPYNIKDGVIFIGDSKGTCYSGQGLFNAFNSAKEAADYLLKGKEYNYSVCQPLRNIGFLNMVWQLNTEHFRTLFKNITKFTNDDLFKFLTGTIDNEFMIHALKSTPKELRGVIAKVTNKPLLLRSFLNGKPKESDYKLWYE